MTAYEYRGSNPNVSGGSVSEQIHAIRVSADYFALFGAEMARGRPFTNDEDRPNGPHVAVLSYGLWQRRFGGSNQVLGRILSLGDTPYEIVGVIARNFDTELDAPPDVFLPFQIDPASTNHAQYFNVVGRLRPGVTLAVARERLQTAANEFRRKFPKIMGAKDGFGIQRLQDAIVTEARPALLILTGAVLLVLLIACANVANLLLARATGRKREIAIRSAIGAGRWRIVRQLLTESIVLSAIGGALGLWAGTVGVRVLLALNPGDIPRLGSGGAGITIDGRLLLFTAVVSLITGVLFGLVPASGIAREDLGVMLKKGGGRSGTSRRQNRTRSLLVTSETSLALILLIGSGLLIRSFLLMRTVGRGVDTHHILTMRMSLAGSRFTTTDKIAQLVRETTRQLDDLPGVTQACASYSLPLDGAFGVPFNIVGRSTSNGRYDGRGWLTVSPGYFESFNIPVLHGRVFSDRDNGRTPPVAIVSETLARRYWPNGNAIGGRLILGKGYGSEFEEPAREIIGVVGDVLDFGSKAPQALVYVPMAQVTNGVTALLTNASSLAWIIRAKANPYSLRPAVARVLRQATGGAAITQIRSMEDVVVKSTAATSFQMTLLTIFGGAALMLAAIGVYGLMAYSMQERTQEVGIRLALGAEPRNVRNMLMLQGARWAMLGVPIGIAATLVLSRLIAAAVFGVIPWDALTFLAATAFLTAAILFAVWLPARRAIRIDPVLALRHE